MTNAELEFLSILKSAVHKDSTVLIINDSDWIDIINTAKKQNLFPLLFDAAHNLPGFEKIEDKYFDSVVAEVSVQMHQTSDFLQLYKSLIDADLSPIILKGIICRSLYGCRADFRYSGDEDILIRKKDYTKFASVLEKCGYQPKETPDKNLDLIQEVTFMNPESSLIVELHLNPFGTDDAIRIKMNEWFKNVYDTQEILIIDGIPVKTLEPTDHFLFLIFHAFKHFIYGGFGIRLMLDILLFAERYSSRIDLDYVLKGLNDVGAIEFYSDMVSAGNSYLGFKLSLPGKTCAPEELLNDMFRMGTFGNTTTVDHVAALFIADAVQKSTADRKSKRREKGLRGQRKFYSIIQRVFPAWQSWTSWYPYLVDKPYMLPVEWMKRTVRYFRGEADMGSIREINESYLIAKHRIELLEKYNIIHD